MDSATRNRPRGPRSLKSLVSCVNFSDGNNLIHQFVLENCRLNNSRSMDSIRAVFKNVLMPVIPAVKLHVRNKRGFTALHLAVIEKSLEMVKLLIEAGANINCRDQMDNTPLLIALYGGWKEQIAKLLVERGADVNLSSSRGLTPLVVAVLNRTWEMVEILIEKGADVHHKDNQDLLQTAVNAECWKIAKVLVRAGAKWDYMSWNQDDTLLRVAAYILAKGGNILNLVNNRGETLLHIAAHKDRIQAMKHLISKGADLNIYDKEGKTPLHKAIGGTGLEAVKPLVKSGAFIEAPSNYGITPLYLAVCKQDQGEDLTAVIKYLISKNADLNAADILGMTPLHIAVRYGSIETVKELVKNGALLNVKDRKGQTPLHFAARKNAVDKTEFLIASGADVNTKDSNDRTPLHEAVTISRHSWNWNEYFRVVEALVKTGAVVEEEDKDGETALSIAEGHNYIDIVDLLKGRVAANAVESGNEIETSHPEAASLNATVPFKKRRTSET